MEKPNFYERLIFGKVHGHCLNSLIFYIVLCQK